MEKIIASLSFVGVGLLLSITLLNTNPELDVQDWYFICVATGLSIVALLTVFFNSATRTNHPKAGVRFGLVDYLVVLFFIWQFINYQFISPIDATAEWVQAIYLMILYGSLRILFSTHKHLEKFLIAAIVICGLAESVLGLMQLSGIRAPLHHLFAFTGTFFNTGPYGGFLAVTMSLALGYMIAQYSDFEQQCKQVKQHPLIVLRLPDFTRYLLCILSFCCAFIVFFAAMSRAAIVALLISAIVVICTQKYTKTFMASFFAVKRKKKMLLVGAIAAILLSGIGATYYLKKESADGRVLMWKVSWAVMLKQPVGGSGFGTYCGAYGVGQADYFKEHPASPAVAIADVPEYGFNEYLERGVETGVIGMALFLSILLLALYKLLKAKSLLAYGLIAIMVFAFFSYPFSQLPFQILIVIFIATGAGYRRDFCARQNVERIGGRISKALMCLLFLITGLELSGIYREKIDTTKAWKQLRPIYQAQSYDVARKEYAELYPLMKDNPRFLFEYGHTLNKTGRFTQSNAILKEGAQLSADPMFYNIIGNNYKGIGDYNGAEKAYKYAFDMLPNRLYPLYLLMKLYEESEQKEKAGQMARRVIDFPPKVDSPAIRDMKREARELLK